ncbi:hypothetical protein DFP72DRAFT_852883 [Ephemerocybe angulata]|uniref:Uncharacterized protein n=1 Tax=Ephemerocybe angulata TaxID=980116 RepID=A0A8H6LYR3_9AGAR|nr:hypothetical protein DFP72DRAFT_852883 [Tulosesus angulatus]
MACDIRTPTWYPEEQHGAFYNSFVGRPLFTSNEQKVRYVEGRPVTVRCIWTKGVTIGKILYILTRYGPVIRAISNFIGKPSDSTQWTFRESKWDGGAPRVYVMILLGLYAMLGGKRRVMWLFGTVSCLYIVPLVATKLAVDLTHRKCTDPSGIIVAPRSIIVIWDIRWGMWGRVIMLMWRTRGYLCLKSRVYDADLMGQDNRLLRSIRRLGGGFYLSEVGE